MRYTVEISNDEINELPLLKFEGKSVVITSKNDIKNTIDELRDAPYVGFDTETKPNFVKGNINSVGLIQFSLEHKAFLIRINRTGLTDEILDFFESDTKKIGIALHDDIKGLQRLGNFEPDGFINVNKITYEMGIINQGIRKLAGILLGGRVSKSQQLSNWDAPEYTSAQINYAATDAWVCWKMYNELIEHGHVKL